MTASALFGALLVTGAVADAWFVADVTVLGWALGIAVAYPSHRPPAWLLILVVAITGGALTSADPLTTVNVAARVFGLGVVGSWVWQRFDPVGFGAGITGALAPQTLALGVTALSDGREHGLGANASVTAQMGLAAWYASAGAGAGRLPGVLTAAVTIAAASSRAVLGAAVASGVLAGRKRRLLETAGLVGAFLLVAWSSGDLERFTFSNTVHGIRDRIETNAGTSTHNSVQAAIVASAFATPAPGIGGAGPIAQVEAGTPSVAGTVTPKTPVAVTLASQRFRWLGTGVGAYTRAEAKVRPHNWPEILVLEMGLLAAVPLVLAVWAVVTRRVGWAFVLSLGPLVLFTDEAVGVAAGHYLLAAFGLSGLVLDRHREELTQQRVNDLRRADVIPLQHGMS